MSEDAARRARRLALALAALVVLGAGLGLKDPWPADEPRFALIAQEMLASGDWLFPHRAGELYPDKPPVYFWALATCYRLLDGARLAHQIPSFLAGLGILWLTWDLSRRLWGDRVAAWAAGFLLVSAQFVLVAKSAQIDATLCFFTTLSLWGLLRHRLLGPNWAACWLGCAAAGVGVITKGVGFLPLLVLIPWERWLGRARSRATRPVAWGKALVGLAALLTPILLWLIPMILASQGHPDLAAYRDEILLRQTATRYADSWGHRKPPWYLIQSLLGLWIPGTLLLPWLLPAWWRRARRGDARFGLPLAWIAVVILFFSLSPGKRGIYIFPALPAFALVTAPLLPALVRRRGVQRVAIGALAALAGVLALGASAAAFDLGGLGARALEELEWKPAGFLLVAAALSLAWLASRRPANPTVRLAGGLASIWVVAGWWLYPVLDPVRSGRDLMEEVETHLGTTDELVLVEWREQLVLHAHRPIVHFGYHVDHALEAEAARAWAAAHPGARVLTPQRIWPEREGDRITPLSRRHRSDWILVDPEPPRQAVPETLPRTYRFVPPGAEALTSPPRRQPGSAGAPG